MFDRNQKALDRYNKLWTDENAYMMIYMYNKATFNRSPKFGCHLQDEILTRFGARIKGHKTRKHYGKEAQQLLNWVTR